MAKLVEIYEDGLSEFEDLLREAEEVAITQWEMDFVEELSNRYDTYQEQMFLSAKQQDTLDRIVSKK